MKSLSFVQKATPPSASHSGKTGATAAALVVSETPERRVAAVLEKLSRPHPLAPVLIPILAENLVGHCVLPVRLGLSKGRYDRLLARVFGEGAGPHLADFVQDDHRLREAARRASARGDLRLSLAKDRDAEVRDVERLLCAHADQTDTLSQSIARVVALGCLGSAHLYRDLGLPARHLLRELLTFCFPTLVQKNVHDMRWKRFFYRKLCEQGGDYVCRAPTCQQCSSRSECFEVPDPTGTILTINQENRS